MKKNVNNIKTYSFNEVFKKNLKSKKFREAYNEELARLNISQQIREMRHKQKLTQKTVAERAKMPQSVIARIESGTHGYSLGTLQRVAYAFKKEIKLM
ncbi:MAG: helix-turn-helix transcriptional regulator [bacterium]|nr:helix-turn-helix transcriptional regulator [bacterium]